MRLEVTRKAHLAIRAMRALAAADGRMKGIDLAAEIDTSTAFLAQVMTPLVRKGWVDSEPGRTGGYTLAVPPNKVAVLEVIETTEGPTENEICVLRGSPCSNTDACAVHDAWQQARDVLLGELSTKSITGTHVRG